MKKIWIILTTLAVSFIAMTSVTTVSAAKPNYIITTDATYPPFDFKIAIINIQVLIKKS